MCVAFADQGGRLQGFGYACGVAASAEAAGASAEPRGGVGLNSATRLMARAPGPVDRGPGFQVRHLPHQSRW